MAADPRALHKPRLAHPLPSGWTWHRLDSVCEDVFDCPHSTPELAESGPYIARSQDIRSGVFDTGQAGRVNEETYLLRIARAEPRHGDLLYSREGTYFGIAAEVPRDVRLCLGQRMVLLRPNSSGINSRYLKYWLNSPLMAAHIHGYRDGSVAERLNMPTIRALPVVLPPIADQDAIALILGALDDKIALNRCMAETLEAIARALFKSWFVDFDPVRAKAEGRETGLPEALSELFPTEIRESPIGEVPRGWDVIAIDQVCELVKGRSYKSEELSASDTALVTLKSFLRGGGYRVDGLKEFTGSYRSEQVVRPGEIIVACTDVTQAAELIGRTAIVYPSRYPTLVASLDLMILRPKDRLTSAFVYLLGRTDRFLQHNLAHCTGTTVLHLAKEALPSFLTVVPPAPVLEAFERAVGGCLHRLGTLHAESETLANLRDALLPKLLSGELRISAEVS